MPARDALHAGALVEMMTIANIPDEVFLVALDYMKVDRPDEAGDARVALFRAERTRDYQRPDVQLDGWSLGEITAFALALAQYVSLSGPFSPQGEFAGIRGYSL